MKEQRGLISAVNEMVVAEARGRVVQVLQVLIDQEKTARPDVAKIFRETQTAFRDRCDKIDRKLTI
jgi:hypothetical protein